MDDLLRYSDNTGFSRLDLLSVDCDWIQSTGLGWSRLAGNLLNSEVEEVDLLGAFDLEGWTLESLLLVWGNILEKMSWERGKRTIYSRVKTQESRLKGCDLSLWCLNGHKPIHCSMVDIETLEVEWLRSIQLKLIGYVNGSGLRKSKIPIITSISKRQKLSSAG
jgi:hypothetical protein